MLKPLTAALILGITGTAASATSTLEAWAVLPAATFADGPTSGQFIGTGPYNGSHTPPFAGQPVQGFSAVLDGPVKDTYYVMSDNGYGSKPNSADYLLRIYAVKTDWTAKTVSPVDFSTGAALPRFNGNSFITLSDPDKKLGFAIQADYNHYYDNAANPLVDNAIKGGRLLTGADLDIEAIRKDKYGNFWIGDEFGPFLIKTDSTGKVLRSVISLPGVQAPQNPYLGGGTPNLPTSRGFEGMALNKSGDKLYTLLEGTVSGDSAGRLRINEFDLATESYTGSQVFYQMDPMGAAIGDMTAIDDHRFLVIERDNGQGVTALFKKIFLVDISQLDTDGVVKKTELVDLMNIADPLDLNGDGSTMFTFPFVTIEDVLLVDSDTLLVINDNNYPFSAGRTAGVADNNEFILVTLSQPIPEPETYAMMLAGLGLLGFAVRRRARA